MNESRNDQRITLGLLAGTGALDLFEPAGAPRLVETPYGAPSSELWPIDLGGTRAWMLARHGRPATIAPHKVNYRANIDALRQLGVTHSIGIYAVGGVDPALRPGDLVVCDQLIDYTWGRQHSFETVDEHGIQHIEFAEPFAGQTRPALLAAARAAGVSVHEAGCYGATQGPRLETAAEIARLARDGCHVVGMTGMPEAGLAREAGLDHAGLCVVANPAAGVTDEVISVEAIHAVLKQAMQDVARVLAQVKLARSQ